MIRLRHSKLGRLVGILAVACAAAALTNLPIPALAADIHVPAAQPTIAAALTRAAVGDRVLLAPGTYNEHGLQMPEGVTLAGSGDSPAAVVINGQGAGRILMCENFARTAEIRNLTFIAGRAEGTSMLEGSGGALQISDAAVNVIDCVFRSNSAARSGGAVWVFEASPTFSGCVFVDNTATGGGGGMDCTLYASPACRTAASRGTAPIGAPGCRAGTIPRRS